jgi:hypothetical protein
MVRNAAQQAMTPVRDLDVHAAVGRIRASKLPA